MTFLQLIQPKVQNSISTTRPRRLGVVSGSLLIQRSPDTSGADAPRRTPCAAADPNENEAALSATTTKHASQRTAMASSPSSDRPASSYRPSSASFRP